jgi:hypothetical protein
LRVIDTSGSRRVVCQRSLATSIGAISRLAHHATSFAVTMQVPMVISAGGLHGACVVRCERVLRRQSPTRPESKIVNVLEVTDLYD